MDGGCSCGEVRYSLNAQPLFVNCCHCLDCQKQTGGAFVINALIETAQIPLTRGTPERIAMPTDSGRPHDIYRCPTCKVALWSDYGRRGYLVFLRALTLDEPHAITPDAHIFTRSKVPWVDLGGDLPDGTATGKPAGVYDIYYDMKSLWPAESLKRRDAASASAKPA